MDISPERLQKIEQLYHTALEREPGRRSAFLDEACQGDVELRREVETLLAQGDAGGDSTVTMLGPGAQLGPYQIEAPIGAGGMGSVYHVAGHRGLGADSVAVISTLASTSTRPGTLQFHELTSRRKYEVAVELL